MLMIEDKEGYTENPYYAPLQGIHHDQMHLFLRNPSEDAEKANIACIHLYFHRSYTITTILNTEIYLKLNRKSISRLIASFGQYNEKNGQKGICIAQDGKWVRFFPNRHRDIGKLIDFLEATKDFFDLETAIRIKLFVNSHLKYIRVWTAMGYSRQASLLPIPSTNEAITIRLKIAMKQSQNLLDVAKELSYLNNHTFYLLAKLCEKDNPEMALKAIEQVSDWHSTYDDAILMKAHILLCQKQDTADKNDSIDTLHEETGAEAALLALQKNNAPYICTLRARLIEEQAGFKFGELFEPGEKISITPEDFLYFAQKVAQKRAQPPQNPEALSEVSANKRHKPGS